MPHEWITCNPSVMLGMPGYRGFSGRVFGPFEHALAVTGKFWSFQCDINENIGVDQNSHSSERPCLALSASSMGSMVTLMRFFMRCIVLIQIAVVPNPCGCWVIW